MTPAPGYLLPAGDAFTDQLACTLVFYPDKPEYRRALLGSIVYLSNWLAWERDTDKRGKDAARAWKLAVEETMECWTMACFEELMADVERIRVLLETKKDCCDDNVTYYPTEEPITVIQPEIGDPPEFYGETAVADWDEWLEHLCYNAHKYVDYLKDTAGQINEAVSVNSIYLGLIAAGLAVLSFSGIGLPIAFGLAALVVTGLALSATVLTFGDTADDFEDARQDIICALMVGHSLSDAVEAALGSGTDWDLFYQWIDYDAATAILYEGGWDDEFLPTEMRDDCVCAAEGQFLFEWELSDEWWRNGQLAFQWYPVEEIMVMTPDSTGSWRYWRGWAWSALASWFGFSLPITYDQVRFKFQNHSDAGSAVRQLFEFRIYDNDATVQVSPEYDTDDFTDDEWHEITWNLDEIQNSGTGDVEALYMRMYRYGPVTDFRRLWLDDFGVYLR